MIMLSRLNGPAFALNPDLIERAEATPDTILTLCDGSKVLVAEPVDEVVERVREYRASVVSLAHRMDLASGIDSEQPAPVRSLNVVPLRASED